MVQQAVQELCASGSKLTDDLDAQQLASATWQIDALGHPLGPDDIRLLMALLPHNGDTAAGLNWAILHAIEASPEWPLWDMLQDHSNEWVRILRLRLANGGISPPVD